VAKEKTIAENARERLHPGNEGKITRWRLAAPENGAGGRKGGRKPARGTGGAVEAPGALSNKKKREESVGGLHFSTETQYGRWRRKERGFSAPSKRALRKKGFPPWKRNRSQGHGAGRGQ